MANPIVTLNVSQQVPPTPSTLQQTGALISQGATTLTAQTYSLLTQLSSLTSLLVQAKAISSLSWGGGEVTATTAAPHGFTDSDTLLLTIAGAVPSGYNGTYTCTVTGASTFTYPLAVSPGSETAPGTYIPASVAEVANMATTFFAQGAIQPVYVLELGPGNASDGVTALTTWITANPLFFYAYLIPAEWDANSSLLAFLPNYEALSAKVYFFVTTTAANLSHYTAQMKCVFPFVPSPTASASEFGAAMPFYNLLVNRPGPGNRMPQMEYRYAYGVTPWPILGNKATISSILAAEGSVVLTGAEGGISNAVLYGGTMADGNDALYWYSVDWIQINSDLALSNTIINGSNTTINPLYISQDGVNRLQNSEIQVVSNAVQYGLATGAAVRSQTDSVTFATNIDDGVYVGQNVVNAVPYATYYQQAPGDYKLRKYSGLQVQYIPAAGFDSIIVNIEVTQFVG